MSNTLRVAICGSGYGIRVIHPCLDFVDGLSVVAHVTRRPERFTNVSIPAYASIESLIEDDVADLVCVATPPVLHEPICQTVLAAGKHVLCEKPLSKDLPSAKAMAVLAQKSAGLALVDHQLRFHPPIKRIRKLLHEERLGKILFAELTYGTSTRLLQNRPHWHWWFDRAAGGGQLFALGSHLIDLVRFCLGEPVSVSAELITAFPQRYDKRGVLRDVSADEAAFLQLRLENGTPLIVGVSSLDADEPMMNFDIRGEKGTLRYKWGSGITIFSNSGEQTFEPENDPLKNVADIGENAWRRALVHLGHAIVAKIQNTEMVPIADFYDGLRVQRVMDAALKSHQKGRRLNCAP